MSKRGFWQRMKLQYRVSILNENTLNETWHIRLSRWGLLAFGIALFLFIFALFALLVWCTPIRNYLPGYNENIRQELVVEMAKVDSLTAQMAVQTQYLESVKAVVSGQLESDSIAPLDSLLLQSKEALLEEKSPALETFMAQYELKEKDNLTVFSATPSPNTPLLFRPAHGVIERPFAPLEGSFGVSIRTPKDENITAVLSGTVVYTAADLNNEWMLMVQHEGGYLSIYRNAQRLLKKVGDAVQLGESVAIASSSNPLVFELWRGGVALDPQERIAF